VVWAWVVVWFHSDKHHYAADDNDHEEDDNAYPYRSRPRPDRSGACCSAVGATHSCAAKSQCRRQHEDHFAA